MANGNSAYLEGTIARVVKDRGFGFITATDGTDYFFHMSGLKNATIDILRLGEKVRFLIEPDTKGKGPRANSVERMR